MSEAMPRLGEIAQEQESRERASWRVLVVDDEPFNVDLLRFELEDRGLQVITAGDGREALRLLQAGERPDLALLDVMMPYLDGIGLTRAIRELPGLENLPIILLTAKGELEDKVEGFQARADDYVVKPFDIEDVFARVEVQLRIGFYLKRRRAHTEAHSRVAMVGAAAHELAQPLAGASGYLQLLQATVERAALEAAGFDSRIERIRHCLLKTRDVARRLEQLERVALEDYPCGSQIINLQESIQPVVSRDPDDPRLLVLPAEAGTARDSGAERELARQGVILLEEEALAGREAEVDLVLLSAADRPELVLPVLERLRKHWEAPQLLMPPVLALLPGRGLESGTPGVGLIRLGVQDVLARPYRLEELLLRLRSRVRLQRLRMSDLLTQSLDAARQVREAALSGFIPHVDNCLVGLEELRMDDGALGERLADFSRQLDGLTGAVRRLQARNVPGLGGAPRE
ncbi:MAG: response regulator [Candidatus Delongbacteria bacterium]